MVEVQAREPETEQGDFVRCGRLEPYLLTATYSTSPLRPPSSSRDGLDRVISRTAGSDVERYGYTGAGDSGAFVMDNSNAVVERSLGLPGGVAVTLRSGSQVWSYPNMHGDTVVVTDGSGAKQGVTRTYDPYGNTTGQPIVDNSAGSLDHGMLGQYLRPTEHETGLAITIEMGARQYDPILGRFLEVDPIEGGSANDYDYVSGDPVNGLDLDGTCKTHHRGLWGAFRSIRCRASHAIHRVGHGIGRAIRSLRNGCLFGRRTRRSECRGSRGFRTGSSWIVGSIAGTAVGGACNAALDIETFGAAAVGCGVAASAAAGGAGYGWNHFFKRRSRCGWWGRPRIGCR